MPRQAMYNVPAVLAINHLSTMSSGSSFLSGISVCAPKKSKGRTQTRESQVIFARLKDFKNTCKTERTRRTLLVVGEFIVGTDSIVARIL